MPYIGKSPLHGSYSKLDSISGSFNGSTTQFALADEIKAAWTAHQLERNG